MIRVATLFSGVGTPEQSLKHLKVEHETVFACEIDKYARITYLANNQEPKTFYDDVKKLDRKVMKNWYNGVQEDLITNNIFSLWASENEEECDLFLSNIVTANSSIK